MFVGFGDSSTIVRPILFVDPIGPEVMYGTHSTPSRDDRPVLRPRIEGFLFDNPTSAAKGHWPVLPLSF